MFILLIASSCAPVYVPNIRNSPMFSEGGEFQGSVSAGNGLEAQAALSLTKHIGVIGNYSYINRDRVDVNSGSSQDGYHRHKFYEGGIGYYENQEKMFMEVFVGYGEGEGSSYDSYDIFGTQTTQATGKYQRYFLQPAFGFNKRTMHVSFVPRFSLVDFTEFSDGTTSVAINEDPVLFFEPAVIGRVNFAENRLFFAFQGGFSASVMSSRFYDHRPFQLSAGLGFRIGGRRPDAVAK